MPQAKRKRLYRPHYSTTTDARVVQSREALRQALLTLLDLKPLEQITIRDITATAGVGYNTFFRHHKNKEALLNEIAADEIKHLTELAMASLDASDVSAATRALCNYVAEHDLLWSTLLNGGAANTLREEFIRRSRDVAAERIVGSDWLPVDVSVLVAASGTIEVLTWWLAQSKRVPVEQLATIYEEIVVAPIINARLREGTFRLKGTSAK